MSIQTTYIPAEDNPANWFTAREVAGPAIVTAILGGLWQLHALNSADPHAPAILETSAPRAFAKLFIPIGHVLRCHQSSKHDPSAFVSGYRLVPVY